MKRISWILVLLLTASFSGRLVLPSHNEETICCSKAAEKNISAKAQEEEALGTMMLLPVSYNLNVIEAGK